MVLKYPENLGKTWNFLTTNHQDDYRPLPPPDEWISYNQSVLYIGLFIKI